MLAAPAVIESPHVVDHFHRVLLVTGCTYPLIGSATPGAV
jgi:hypothetical protein